jgi:hypothetical protein
MKLENIKTILENKNLCPSKWELDTIIWADRTKNPKVLIDFLERIDYLNTTGLEKTLSESQELTYLLELLEDMSEDECQTLLSISIDDEYSKDLFVENLSRKAAIEVICRNKLTEETISIACKLSPNDFILLAKRTQDLVDTIVSFTIKGEQLSKDIAGA